MLTRRTKLQQYEEDDAPSDARMTLLDLPPELYERVLRLLGGHILLAAPTCTITRDVANTMKGESNRLPLPVVPSA